MAVSPKLTSFRIRDPLAVRLRLESLSVADQKKTHSQHTLSVQGYVVRFVFAGEFVHRPERGIPFMVQLMVGEGMPSAWQSSLTVSPGAYN